MFYVVSVLRFFAELTPASRWLWLGVWLLAGFVIFVASPWLASNTEETKSEEPRFQQQDVTIGSPTASANGNESGQVASAPVQIDKSSKSTSGNIETSIGNTVNERRTVTGGIHYWFIGGTNTIHVNEYYTVRERSAQVETDDGGKAEIKIYMLYDSAAWSYNSFCKLISHSDRDIELNDFLESLEFSQDVRNFDAIVCLGLVSGVARGSVARTMALSDERAVHLCGLVSRKIEAMLNRIKIFGLPLGYHKNSEVTRNSREERRQRSVVLLGIKSLSGTLQTEAEQQMVTSRILENDIIDDFRFSDYSAISAGQPLRYIRIERGTYHEKCAAQAN